MKPGRIGQKRSYPETAILLSMEEGRVQRVLILVLGLNILVALLKGVFGYLAGSVSMVADAFHSGFDSLSNVVGIIVLVLAAKPPDWEHPYGHGKIETLGTMIIGAMLLVTAAGIIIEGYERLIDPVPPDIAPITIAVMVSTVVINLAVSTYEQRKGEEYQSQILSADATHTRSDVFVSLSVLGGFIAVGLGFPRADPLIALGIGILIVRMGLRILYDAGQVLSDSRNLPCDMETIRAGMMSVPGVSQYHNFRCRGKPGELFGDIHITVDPELTVAQGHEIAVEVERRLKATVPGLVDVVVHIEPESNLCRLERAITRRR
jgi:cation diffusion facilitator family transporter